MERDEKRRKGMKREGKGRREVNRDKLWEG